MFATQYGPWALITGGSEGTGAEFARQLAARGVHLVLVARNPGPLEVLAAELRGAVQVRTLTLDLTAGSAVAAIEQACADIDIGLLVCNAGSNTHFADFTETGFDYAQRVTALNALTPLALTHHFAAKMRTRGRGGIILVGSMAGYSGSAHTAVYCAAKAFSRVLAEGLWFELKPFGVHVLGLMLSATNTPAMARLGMIMDNPEFPADDPAVVVAEGLDQLPNGPIWVARGRADMAKFMSGMERSEAVTLMSNAGRALFAKD